MKSTFVKQYVQRSTLVGLFVTILALALNVGCFSGDGIDRCVVTGMVTYDGKPLPNGEIRFRADNGPLSGGPILDGKYRIDHQGGVPVGKHTVTITARRMLGSDKSAGALDSVAGQDEQYIPEQYNKKSELKVDLTGDENPATQNFDLDK